MLGGNILVGSGMALMGLASLLPSPEMLPALIAAAALSAVRRPELKVL